MQLAGYNRTLPRPVRALVPKPAIAHMPELPEVETIRSAMARHLTNRAITGVWMSAKRLRAPVPRKRLLSLVGDRFGTPRRRAKFLLLDLLSGRSLLVHLGMTGNLVFRAARHKHDHLRIDLSPAAGCVTMGTALGGTASTRARESSVIAETDPRSPPLVFSDPRRFGLLAVLEPGEEETSKLLLELGVEPLEPEFSPDYLQAQCRGRSRPIKNLLLDGRIVAGVGNIYASESLFRAGIRPTTRAHRLSRPRLARLVGEIKAVLSESIRLGGTTISDYLGSGDGGLFQQELAVYGRADNNCLVCDAPVKSIVQAGRSSFYCPSCQK